MAHAQYPTADHHMNREPIAFPFLAVLSAFGAALAFAGGGAAVRYLGGNPAGMVAGTVVMVVAGTCLPIPGMRPIALLLTWNGLGIAVGMLVITIFSVGALMAFPLALTALALSAWPRPDGEPVASRPAIAVQVAGVLLPFILYGLVDNTGRWLGRLIGL